MWKAFLQVAAGILGIWLAIMFVPNVQFAGSWKTLVLAGVILGLINFFIKPILNLITFPLRVLTFGLFGLVINMLMVWVIDIFFTELIITGLIPLFWTSLIVWGIDFILIKLLS